MFIWPTPLQFFYKQSDLLYQRGPTTRIPLSKFDFSQ